MFKISFYIRKNKNKSNTEFKEYWLGEHAKQLQNIVEDMGVRRLTKCEVLPENSVGIGAAANFQTQGELYDFVDHWEFGNIEPLKACVNNKDIQEKLQALYLSENSFVDIARSDVFMDIELAQFYPSDAKKVIADENSKYIKLFYCVRRKAHLTTQQAQLHWNACHGGMAREDIDFASLKKYIQSHKIEATYINQLIQQRGYNCDDSFIGSAEAWIDLEQKPKDFTGIEHIKQEADEMSLDDTFLFAEQSTSQVFVSYEHRIIDKKIFERPLPTLFSTTY